MQAEGPKFQSHSSIDRDSGLKSSRAAASVDTELDGPMDLTWYKAASSYVPKRVLYNSWKGGV